MYIKVGYGQPAKAEPRAVPARRPKPEILSVPEEPPVVVAFDHYAKVFDKVLWSYEGLSHEYLVILAWLREAVAKARPELEVTICGTEKGLAWLAGEPMLITPAQRAAAGYAWGASKIFRTSPAGPHPVARFAGGLDLSPVARESGKGRRGRAAIVTRGAYPSQPLTDSQIDAAYRKARDIGCEAYISEDHNDPESLSNVAAVLGSECAALWRAAREGKRVAMPATSIGYHLMKSLRPDVDVLPNA